MPALGQFLTAMIFKYPEFVQTYYDSLLQIIKHLMTPDIRMEQVSLQIGSAVFEKIGVPNPGFLKEYMFSIFTSMHFYRNNTKSKIIPLPIIKSIWTFFTNFMVYNGSQLLVETCNQIQQDIIFMILKSEGDKIKYITAPARDRKYTIVAFSKFIREYLTQFPAE